MFSNGSVSFKPRDAATSGFAPEHVSYLSLGGWSVLPEEKKDIIGSVVDGVSEILKEGFLDFCATV